MITWTIVTCMSLILKFQLIITWHVPGKASLGCVSVFGQRGSPLADRGATYENYTVRCPTLGNSCPRMHPHMTPERGIGAPHRGQRNRQLRRLGGILSLARGYALGFATIVPTFLKGENEVNNYSGHFQSRGRRISWTWIFLLLWFYGSQEQPCWWGDIFIFRCQRLWCDVWFGAKNFYYCYYYYLFLLILEVD